MSSAPTSRITRAAHSQTLDQLLHRLNPVLRGWCAYFRHGANSRTFGYLHAYTWRRAIIWLRHRLAWASRSRLKPFVRLARTLRAHRDGILAAIRLGLSNGRLGGLNSKIRLISHRSFGFHSADALIALVYLCCTGIAIDLPR